MKSVFLADCNPSTILTGEGSNLNTLSSLDSTGHKQAKVINNALRKQKEFKVVLEFFVKTMTVNLGLN